MLTAISLSLSLIGCYLLIGMAVVLSNISWKKLQHWFNTASHPIATLLFAFFLWPLILTAIIRHKLKR